MSLTSRKARALACVPVLVCALLPVRAAHAETAVLEIESEELGWVEPKVVRRLVALELADLHVPAPKGARGRSVRGGLFVRVLRYETQMVVELWERGELAGQRRLTSEGSSQVRARRIALAAGELARRLREQRLADERKWRRRAVKQAQEAALRRGVPIYALLGLSPALRAGMTGAGDSLWAGPEISASLSAAQGPLLVLSASVLFGATPRVEALGSAEWWELALSPGYAFKLGAGMRLVASLNVAAAALHATGPTQLDGGGSQSWSARAGGAVWLQAKVSRTTELEFGPELGAILRRVPAQLGDASSRFGGVWTGFRFGIRVTPNGAW